MPALSRQAAVAVIGTGAMGCGIAQIAAQGGHRVLLFDTRLGAAEDARRRIVDTFKRLVDKGRLTRPEATDAADRIGCVHALGGCVSAGLVVEAIVEDLGVKRELFVELERIVAPQAILASNTSSLSITAIGAACKRPERVVGMHFFNPAPVLPLVEVVSGVCTSAEVAQAVYETALAWGKRPVYAKSTPGFIVNRCARPFYGEALRLLAEGAGDAATLDAVMRDAGGFRMGAFELMDLIGHDVNFAVTRSVWEAFFHDPRYTPSPIQHDLVVSGRLGRKTGRGFHDYASGAVVPAARKELPQARPAAVTVHGDLGPARALLDRLSGAGIPVERRDADARFPDGAMVIGKTVVALTDGRSATLRAMQCSQPDLVLFDLAFDYASCTLLAIACSDTCTEDAANGALGALQAAGIGVSRLDDTPGLCVMRTVAMLANEAAEAIAQGVATAPDIDLAMCSGVNYPRGPVAWADVIGVSRVRAVIANLAAHYGEDRYRVAPLLARRWAAGQPLHKPQVRPPA